MSDKQNPNDPEYDWLYAHSPAESSGSSDTGSPGSASPPDGTTPNSDQTQVVQHGVPLADPDQTQLIQRQAAPSAPPPRPSAPSAPSGPPRPSAPSGPAGDATQVIGVTPPGAAAPSETNPPTRIQPQPPRSFGGTYPTPPPAAQPPYPSPANTPASAPPRFATPTQVGPTGPRPHAPMPLGASSAPPPPRRKRNWWVRGILLLFLAWLLFLVAVPIWTWQHVSKVDAEPSGDRPPDTGGTTYLLVGSDSREGLSQRQEADLGTGDAAGQRTDTIIVLHVPSGDGPNLLLSIPRDSLVDVPGHGQDKINAAYAYGGPELLVQTVEQATDVRIDDYVEIGFAGFVDAIDAVGGIQICPEQAIHDPKAGNLNLAKGCQDVDGHTALDYSRSRNAGLGDITRALHQREVITKAGAKAASWQTVVFPWRYLAVNRAAADSLHVGENVGPVDLARFGWAMAHTGGSDAKRCVVPYSDLGASTSAGSAVIWDKAKAAALFKALREDDTASIECSVQ